MGDAAPAREPEFYKQAWQLAGLGDDVDGMSPRDLPKDAWAAMQRAYTIRRLLDTVDANLRLAGAPPLTQLMRDGLSGLLHHNMSTRTGRQITIAGRKLVHALGGTTTMAPAFPQAVVSVRCYFVRLVCLNSHDLRSSEVGRTVSCESRPVSVG